MQLAPIPLPNSNMIIKSLHIEASQFAAFAFNRIKQVVNPVYISKSLRKARTEITFGDLIVSYFIGKFTIDYRDCKFLYCFFISPVNAFSLVVYAILCF